MPYCLKQCGIKPQIICLNSKKAVCLALLASVAFTNELAQVDSGWETMKFFCLCLGIRQCTGRCFKHQFLNAQFSSIRLRDSNEG